MSESSEYLNALSSRLLSDLKNDIFTFDDYLSISNFNFNKEKIIGREGKIYISTSGKYYVAENDKGVLIYDM